MPATATLERQPPSSYDAPAALGVDPANAIRFAGNLLAAHPDTRARDVGQWLLDGAHGDLIGHLSDTGSRGGWLAAARERRNAALIEAARLRWPDLPVPRQARLLARSLTLYRQGAWQADRATANPYPEGSFHFWRFEAVSALDKPLTERQVRRVMRSGQTA